MRLLHQELVNSAILKLGTTIVYSVNANPTQKPSMFTVQQTPESLWFFSLILHCMFAGVLCSYTIYFIGKLPFLCKPTWNPTADTTAVIENTAFGFVLRWFSLHCSFYVKRYQVPSTMLISVMSDISYKRWGEGRSSLLPPSSFLLPFFLLPPSSSIVELTGTWTVDSLLSDFTELVYKVTTWYKY